MFTLQSVFASGWIQIMLLLAIFYWFSRWAMRQGAKTGYALGWLIGVFFIVMYGALFPLTPIQVGDTESVQLSFLAVMMSSFFGFLVGIIILGITLILQRAWYRQLFITAGITAVLVTMLFTMIMSDTQAKMAISLASLAFSIVIAIAYVGRRAYQTRPIDAPPVAINDDIAVTTSNDRIERIREQAIPTSRL